MVMSALLGSSAFDYIKSDLSTVAKLQDAKVAFRTRNMLDRLFEGNVENKEEIEEKVKTLIMRSDQVLFSLEDDQNLRGGASTPQMAEELKDTARYWQKFVKPMLLQTVYSLDNPSMRPKPEQVDDIIHTFTERMNVNEQLINQSATSKITNTKLLQTALAFVALGMILLMLWMIQDVSKRSRELSEVAKRIADGNLNVHAPVAGVDELSHLGASFNDMTTKLSDMIASERHDKTQLQALIKTIRETAEALAASASELQDGASAQTQGMKAQSNQINEAVATVHQILGRTDEATSVAEAVVKSSDHAKIVSAVGREAIEHSLQAMTYVKESSIEVFDGIQSLSNDSKEIEEIVAKVSNIAEKTNVLALNASIEASRAGDQGRGFTVVATEIRSLSEESKQITGNVARILNRISKSTLIAQELTDKGKSTADKALHLVQDAGNAIRELEALIGESVELAAKVQAASSMQANGINKIRQAITHVSEVSDENLQTTRKNEDTAAKLSELGNRLKSLSAATVGA